MRIMSDWQQMTLLSEPTKEVVRIEKIKNLASELAGEDAATVNETIKAHRLNEEEVELLRELLNVDYILD